MRKKLLVAVLACLMTIIICSCGNSTTPSASTTAPVDLSFVPKQGDTFLSSGFRIKSTVTPQTVATFDPLVFEVYVDGQGHGTGLVSYKDKVYDVVITSDRLYVKVAENTAVEVSDFTGHILPSNLKVSGSDDLPSLGFGMLDGRVASYKYSDTYFIVDSTFMVSDSTFDSTTITAGNIMSLTELVNYILSVESTGYQVTTEQPTAAVTEALQVMTAKGSFWNNSWLGLKIHDTTYSVGDYCNPTTYFEGMTPESITPSYTYNADDRVELLHLSYQSSDGRTSFLTTEGYVQTISTTSPFQWYTISSDMGAKELKALLGVGLSGKQKEDFTPILAGLNVVSNKGSTITLEYEDFIITITIDSHSDSVTGFTLSKPVEFD